MALRVGVVKIKTWCLSHGIPSVATQIKGDADERIVGVLMKVEMGVAISGIVTVNDVEFHLVACTRTRSEAVSYLFAVIIVHTEFCRQRFVRLWIQLNRLDESIAPC